MDSTGAGGGGGREANNSFNWTDEVDDLLDTGDIDAAISLLESVVSRLETLKEPSSSSSSGLSLASSLDDLANLHSTRGCSLKADELRTHSLLLRARDSRQRRSHQLGSRDCDVATLKEKGVEKEKEELQVHASREEEDEEDDWEAFADGAPPDIGISRVTKEVSMDSSVEPRKPKESATPKRRGRGSFLYKKNGLYSDDVDVGKDGGHFDSEGDSGRACTRGDDSETRNRRFGTRHILVLYDFPPTTRTVDLEKLLERFGDSGVAIRWVNDTCALAVFRTPAVAHEAQNSIRFPFKVRTIDEDDSLLDQVSPRELEPPCPRPKTSARTAHRMIAQVMGLKPSTDFGSSEFRKQEQARKNRIHTRQNMRDDAWGSDD